VSYSFNRNREGIVFARMKDINASFKDLAIVCDAVRYKNAPAALAMLETVESGKMPILYRKYNRYMGSRHELGGQKGRYPMKCAGIVRKVLVNAMANAEGKGEDPQSMYIVHAAANKTLIMQRTAPKGAIRLGHSMGRGSTRRTDLEFARVEIGLGYGEEKGLSEKMKKAVASYMKKGRAPAVAARKKPQPKPKAQEKKEIKVQAKE